MEGKLVATFYDQEFALFRDIKLLGGDLFELPLDIKYHGEIHIVAVPVEGDTKPMLMVFGTEDGKTKGGLAFWEHGPETLEWMAEVFGYHKPVLEMPQPGEEP